MLSHQDIIDEIDSLEKDLSVITDPKEYKIIEDTIKDLESYLEGTKE